VACSGGGDSTALLLFLEAVKASLGLELTVAHANHGLRPEAEEDAAFVAGVCRALDLDLVEACLAVRIHAAASGQGLETAARDLRWAWLRAEARSCRADWIATGHTLDDHTETVFLRLARGGGLGSITPLPPLQAGRWSPLIEARREDLRRYLRSKGVAWREDASNGEDFTARNRIRKLLEPLRDEAPALDAHLWETHLQARELEGWREEQVLGWSPARWAVSGETVALTGGWTPLELRWTLEMALPRIGRSVEAVLLRDLSEWAAPRMSRKRHRPHAWGGWILEPHPPGWTLRPPSVTDEGSGPRPSGGPAGCVGPGPAS
jgi:tRNA(Ile)-lysidine synthetase-like protein